MSLARSLSVGQREGGREGCTCIIIIRESKGAVLVPLKRLITSLAAGFDPEMSM